MEHLELEQKKFEFEFIVFSRILLPGTSTSTSTCVLCTFYNILTFMFVAGTCTLRVCGTEGTQAYHHRYVVRLEDMFLFQKHSTVPLKTKIYFHNFLSDMSPEKTKTKTNAVSNAYHRHHSQPPPPHNLSPHS
jgi:hypothetical protein